MFFITWCCNLERMPVGQFDHLSKKKSISKEFSEAKNQRRKKMYLRGALDSAQIHRMRKVTI
jgi:hypothetical protein